MADKVFVGRFEPASKHNQEVLDEDDAWLGLAAAELWDYDIVDGCEQDFVDAMRNSETVMEFSVIEETSVDPEDAIGTNLGDSTAKAPDEVDFSRDVRNGGSGTRSVDGGPTGQPTGDATAGDMGPSWRYLADEQVDGIAEDGSGGSTA
ncbi:MAG: hypothetical protein ACJ74Z_00605 [Bryobacteraceae bacterium]